MIRDRAALAVISLTLRPARAQARLAAVWREHAWYSPFALVGWGLTRPLSFVGLRLAEWLHG